MTDHSELCRVCGGNGVVKIFHGVSVCDHCHGRCYEPAAPPEGGQGDTLKALARDIGTVITVAERRSDPDADHRASIARLRQWRETVLSLLDRAAPAQTIAHPTCRQCGRAYRQPAWWEEP